MSKKIFTYFKTNMEIKSLTNNTFGKKITQFTELPGLKCVMCANPLLSMKEVDAFIHRVCGQNASMPSSQSITRYWDTLCYQKSTKSELLGYMEHYAKKYPDKTFGEIFELPEVLSLHLDRAHAYYAENFEKNRLLFEQMEKNLSLSPEQKQKLAELHKKAVNIAIGNHSDSVKRYLIMQNYAGFQREIGGTAAAKIIEYARRMPLSPGSPDLALCHMAGKTDAHIMQGLLSKVTPMKKKINPNDGHGVFVCQSCSSDAGLVPFKSLFVLFPNMFRNIQEQLNTIISALRNGHLKGQSDYPKVLTRLVLEATDGEKVLDLNRYYRNKHTIVELNSYPMRSSEISNRQLKKKQRFEAILLRETPDTLKKYLISAEKRKRELLQSGAAIEQIKACEERITTLRKIYIQLLRRDKLI